MTVHQNSQGRRLMKPSSSAVSSAFLPPYLRTTLFCSVWQFAAERCAAKNWLKNALPQLSKFSVPPLFRVCFRHRRRWQAPKNGLTERCRCSPVYTYTHNTHACAHHASQFTPTHTTHEHTHAHTQAHTPHTHTHTHTQAHYTHAHLLLPPFLPRFFRRTCAIPCFVRFAHVWRN